MTFKDSISVPMLYLQNSLVGFVNWVENSLMAVTIMNSARFSFHVLAMNNTDNPIFWNEPDPVSIKPQKYIGPHEITCTRCFVLMCTPVMLSSSAENR